MKAIGYTRCSTHEQADSGLGLDAQAQRIRAYCSMRGLDLLDIIIDAGVSGGKPLAKREGGQRLLAAMKAKQAEAVVMLKLDRMFRNAGDCLTVTDKWERSGVSLHVVDLCGNAIDTTSAAGRFMLVVLAGAAETERNLIGSAPGRLWPSRNLMVNESEVFHLALTWRMTEARSFRTSGNAP